MGDTPFGFLRASDGIRLRYGRWPHKAGDAGNGTIVVLGGRTEFMEKYHETIRRIHARGFNAFSFDWRGQGLSDRILDDPTRGYIQSYDQYVSDMAFFFEMVVHPERRGPLFVLAHSMGANILLHYLKKFPFGVDKGVLLSPMIDIRTAPIPAALARLGCRLMVLLGKGDRNIPSIRRNHGFHSSFPKNRLTHDETRFNQIRRNFRDNPQLIVTGVTYGWLSATFDAIDAMRRPGFARQITTPLLVVGAGNDRVVRNHAIRRFTAQLPAHQTIWIEGARHEILQERDGLQTKFWHVFDQFIAAGGC